MTDRWERSDKIMQEVNRREYPFAANDGLNDFYTVYVDEPEATGVILYNGLFECTVRLSPQGEVVGLPSQQDVAARLAANHIALRNPRRPGEQHSFNPPTPRGEAITPPTPWE